MLQFFFVQKSINSFFYQFYSVSFILFYDTLESNINLTNILIQIN